MSKIDIEEIMSEIRQEIKDKGYSDEMIVFGEIENGDQIDCQYSEEVFLTLLREMNEKNNIEWYRELEGGKLSRILKKVVRKLTSFLGVPVVVDQSCFNADVAHGFSQLAGYIHEQKDEVDKCRQEIALLEDRIEELQKNLKETL
ncbi:MAG: hypothetical protein LIO99_13620 [Clostridiales bacterium]|nr:hypothetical protein [Clostridiales bacterium]MCC8107015.1 hypothetical protein [Clostridiales bacterium]